MEFIDKFLDEVAFYQEGPGVRKFQFRNEGVKLLNVGNINKGLLDTSTTKLYISEEEAYGKYKHFLVDEGDLLIASSGIVVDNFHNKIAYAKKEHLPLCLNTSTIRFKSLDDNLFYLDYLKFYLKTNHFKKQLRKLITGAAQLNFGPSHLKKIKLPIPALQDQHHIANLLSKAETLITQRKETLRLLDEYLKSTFLEMFGDPAINKMKWRILPIRELSLRFSDGPFGSNLKTEHYSDSGIQVIRLQNIGINEFVEKDICYVNLPHYESILKKYSCFPGDIVIATMGVPNIRSCIVPKHLDVAVNKADCVQLRVNPKLANSFYISQLLNLEGFLFLATSFIHGQTRARISSGQIAKIPVPVPPIELQTQFAQIVEKTEALKTQNQQSLQELENLYNTLSQKAFRGELSRKTEPTNHKTRKSLLTQKQALLK
jgi:type I restriction enzyme S subunit